MRLWALLLCFLFLGVIGAWYINEAIPVDTQQIKTLEKSRVVNMKEMEKHEEQAAVVRLDVVKLEPKIQKLVAKAKISYDPSMVEYESLPTLSEEEDAKNELIFTLIKQNDLLKRENSELRISLEYAKKSLKDSELEITLRKAEMEAKNDAIRNARLRGIGEGALAVVITKTVYEMFRK